VIVTGDVTRDCLVARRHKAQGAGQNWNQDDACRTYLQWGGAALLAGLVGEMSHLPGGRPLVDAPRTDEAGADPAGQAVCTSHAAWSPVKPDSSKVPRASWDGTWRITEFIGLDRPRSPYEAPLPLRKASGAPERSPQPLDWMILPETAAAPDLVVIDDAALGFRDAWPAGGGSTSSPYWPAAAAGGGAGPWVLVKMTSPVAEGALWQQLVTRSADRLVVVMDINDLRQSNVRISRGMSWERAAQDLYWELLHNPHVNGVAQCRHAVISFGAAGALLLSSDSRAGADVMPECTLFFDPGNIEGLWRSDSAGKLIGYSTCLAASLAGALLAYGPPPAGGDGRRGEPSGAGRRKAVCAAIQAGIAAMQELDARGWGKQDAGPEFREPVFPRAEIAGVLGTRQAGLATISLPQWRSREADGRLWRDTRHSDWSILQARCTGVKAPDGSTLGSLHQLARSIVEEGHAHLLRNVPLGTFGKLTVADRREIEGFRSIQGLLGEYCSRPQQKPVSIAVFGPPGSGKSFGVKQVAKSLSGVDIEERTFNLSQFSNPTEIIGALHQVRDVVLSGKMPLVFWDEFDTKLDGTDLGWLRYFLAPMQDGQFQEGQVTHYLGQAIFVFAGATCSSMEQFNVSPASDRYGDFRNVKGPDFISRLQGYINILGPDPVGADDPVADPLCPIRRAMILRALLQNEAPQLLTPEAITPPPQGKDGPKEIMRLRMDPGVLNAFLAIPRYKHGVRSMTAIIRMSLLSGRKVYERSCLPAEAQLQVHVDGQDFMELVQAPDLTDRLLDDTAMHLLAGYLRRKGLWLPEGLPADEQARRADLWAGAERELEAGVERGPALRAFWVEALDDADRNANRDSVRHLPKLLAPLGYTMRPLTESDGGVAGGETPTLQETFAARGWPVELLPAEQGIRFAPDDLDALLEQEHSRWLAAKRRGGWAWGPGKKLGALRQSPALLPWRKLRDALRDDNCASVADLLQAILSVGYVWHRLPEPGTGGRLSAAVKEVRIGIVGHRYATDAASLGVGFAAAMRDLREHLSPGPGGGGHRLVFVSPLVEGGARILTHEALTLLGAQLEAVLPLPPDELRRDFATEASCRDFEALRQRARREHDTPPQSEHREDAYVSADEWIVDESDVLLAACNDDWMSLDSHTARSVARALLQGMTVWRIRTGKRKPGSFEADSAPAGEPFERLTPEACQPYLEGLVACCEGRPFREALQVAAGRQP
jgi:hypothetical protein